MVGSETALAYVIGAFEHAGFRRYGQLQRMARMAQSPTSGSSGAEILYGESTDSGAVVNLLESSFNRYADQLPTAYEIGEALENRQILVTKSAGMLAAHALL